MGYNPTNIINMRKIFGLNQTEMGEIVGISKNSYASRERRETLFKINEMEKLAEYFSKRLNRKITINELFFSNNEE